MTVQCSRNIQSICLWIKTCSRVNYQISCVETKPFSGAYNTKSRAFQNTRVVQVIKKIKGGIHVRMVITHILVVKC